jgi:hypothetical protein
VKCGQRDREAILLVDARCDARIEGSHRALGQPLSNVDFELCNLTAYVCDSGKSLAR